MESDPLVHAWEMYWSHRLHGTTNDYKAFEDTVRPLLQQVEAERDALAAELAACQASRERLRWVAVKADDVLGYEIDWDSPSSGEDAWYDLQGAFDLLEEGDLAAPAGEGGQ